MTLQTKTDEELDAEIAAIEEAINRTGGKNLPEIKKSLRQNLSFATIPLTSDHAVVTTPANEDDLSLEDFPSNEQEGLFIPDESFEEPILMEDPSILEDLSFDPFHNIKRS